MSAIPLRDYVVGGLVSEATVNALLAFGEPMLTETVEWEGPGVRVEVRYYRAWIRLRPGCDLPHNHPRRVMGHRWHSTPQFAAVALLAKLRGKR